MNRKTARYPQRPESGTRIRRMQAVMAIDGLRILICLVGQALGNGGSIQGTVVNASRGLEPVAGAEVILQVQVDGQFVAAEESASDAAGRYRFDDLPVGEGIVYLPGASRDGIHYPGPRVQLTARRPEADVSVPVHDAQQNPNPLIIREQQIVIRAEEEMLHVVEAMLVDNPGSTTYVGLAHQKQPPVTLRLGIPRDFDRLTFEEEFFGRQFQLGDGGVVTGLPWTPGPRWLRFTYSMPVEALQGRWQRALDLPCEHLRLRVQSDQPDAVACDLPAVPETASGERVFEASGGTLPAGQVVVLTLGAVPRPWIAYARWGAVAALIVAISVASLFRRRAAGETPPGPRLAGPHSATQGPRRLHVSDRAQTRRGTLR